MTNLLLLGFCLVVPNGLLSLWLSFFFWWKENTELMRGLGKGVKVSKTV